MIKASELSQAIANIWDSIVVALDGRLETFEYQLITLLRQLDNTPESEQNDVILSILKFFQESDTVAYRQLTQKISEISSLSKGTAGSAIFKDMDRHTEVTVFYGTNRAAATVNNTSVSYGTERGELTLGIAKVSIPDDHRMGAIERPGLWKLQFRENPQKHVVVLSLQQLSFEEFAAHSQDALNRGAKKEALVFIHGYDVGFSDAVSRTAQIAYDLKFEGLPALYSWPSENSKEKYTVDEANVEWSRPYFVQFLNFLRGDLGVETIHIIAHSMGNRLVAETIASMSKPLEPNKAKIRQIIFAAPDIDSGNFKNLAKSFHEKAERFTLYASSKDNALKLSKIVHKYPRAGDSSLDLVIVDPVDTIDATAVDTSLVGHSYIGDNRSILTDVFDLIQCGNPPTARFGLVSQKKYGRQYWLFRP